MEDRSEMLCSSSASFDCDDDGTEALEHAEGSLDSSDQKSRCGGSDGTLGAIAPVTVDQHHYDWPGGS